jgi:hypothetical protein
VRVNDGVFVGGCGGRNDDDVSVDGMLDFEFLTRFVMPTVLGGIAGFFSPWAKHYFENRNVRRDDRRALIQKFKRDLLAPEFYFETAGSEWTSDPQITTGTGILPPEESYRRLLRHPTFAELKRHMSPTALEKLSKFDGCDDSERGSLPTQSITIVLGANESLIRDIIANEIYEVEKRWKLL